MDNSQKINSDSKIRDEQIGNFDIGKNSNDKDIDVAIWDAVDIECETVRMLIDHYPDNFLLIFCIVENGNLRDYINRKIYNFSNDVVFFDFNSMKVDGDTEIEEFEKLLLNKKLVVASGFFEYAKFLKDEGIVDKEESFYFNQFNIQRDNFYLKNKVKLILLTTEFEFDIFCSDFADDFTSYATYYTNINYFSEKTDYKIKQKSK